jgi:hypothetical protein
MAGTFGVPVGCAFAAGAVLAAGAALANPTSLDAADVAGCHAESAEADAVGLPTEALATG